MKFLYEAFEVTDKTIRNKLERLEKLGEISNCNFLQLLLPVTCESRPSESPYFRYEIGAFFGQKISKQIDDAMVASLLRIPKYERAKKIHESES